MIKIFNNINIVKKFKLQKNERVDESLKIHLNSIKDIKKVFENGYFLGLYEVKKNDFNTSFLNNVFCNGIEYENKYKVHNYRSLYNFFNIYESYDSFEDSLSSLINNNIGGYILIRVNDQCLGKKEPFIPIYMKKEEKIYLLSQYIYGYVPVTDNHRFGNFIMSSNLLFDYCLENKNLLYEALVEFKLQQKGDKSYHNDKSLEELYQIIVDAYVTTIDHFNKKQADRALSLLLENKVGLFAGDKIKSLLKKYVLYADIKKILATGLNCDESVSLDDLYKMFTLKYSLGEYSKQIIKK